MAVTSVDLDPELMKRARELTGLPSNRAVLDLALRRLVAVKQKGAMLDAIEGKLADLAEPIGAETGAVSDAPVPELPSNYSVL